jgi:hypothetical protein
MKINILWIVTSSNLINRYLRFGGTFYLYFKNIHLKIEAGGSFETLTTLNSRRQ